jgi:N-acylneuraminate cytidylyltransferase
MRIAIIPARGGSKRIPKKNIKLFAGLPILAWSIRAAIESQCFDKIIVSTDDLEIQKIANMYGADTPFLRPANLSGDHIGTIPVIAHAIDWFIKNSYEISEACCIYATAPFIMADDLRRSLDLLSRSDADYVFSVTDFNFPIKRAIRLNSKERVQMLHPEFFYARSQDLEKAWHDAGQFYWGKSKAWLDQTPIFGEKSTVLKLPNYRVQDIDTLDDWQRAELLFEILKSKKLN